MACEDDVCEGRATSAQTLSPDLRLQVGAPHLPSARKLPTGRGKEPAAVHHYFLCNQQVQVKIKSLGYYRATHPYTYTSSPKHLQRPYEKNRKKGTHEQGRKEREARLHPQKVKKR